jgi:hypothetical protein
MRYRSAASFGVVTAVFSLLAMGAVEDGDSAGIRVFIYNVSEAREQVLALAKAQASVVLSQTHIAIEWVECYLPAHPSRCSSPTEPTDLIVRILQRSLPQASANALGITARDEHGSRAAVFYERAQYVASSYRLHLPCILGVVIAHEIVHLLARNEAHSEDGLMRSRLTPNVVRVGCVGCLSIPKSVIGHVRREVARRAAFARSNKEEH